MAMLSEFLTHTVTDWLKSVFSGIVEGLSKNVFVSLTPYLLEPRTFWKEGWAQGAATVFRIIAWELLIVRLVVDVWRLYLSRDSGEAHLGPAVLIRRTAIAAAAISASSWLFDLLLRLASATCRAIADVRVDFDFAKYAEGIAEALIGAAVGGPGIIIIYGVVMLIVVVMMLLLLLQSWVRGAELAIIYVLAPVMAVSTAGNDDFLASGTFGIWWRELLAVLGSQVVAMICALAYFRMLTGGSFEVTEVFGGLVMLYVALKTPSMMRHYAYSTGLGQATNQAIHFARVLSKMPF